MKSIRIKPTWACLLTLTICGTAATALAQDKPQVITNSIGMKLARVPGGTFMMGSPRKEAERDRRETRHEVTITRPFNMGVYEVTQAEYTKVMTGTPDFRNRAAFSAGVAARHGTRHRACRGSRHAADAAVLPARATCA